MGKGEDFQVFFFSLDFVKLKPNYFFPPFVCNTVILKGETIEEIFSGKDNHVNLTNQFLIKNTNPFDKKIERPI